MKVQIGFKDGFRAYMGVVAAQTVILLGIVLVVALVIGVFYLIG